MRSRTCRTACCSMNGWKRCSAVSDAPKPSPCSVSISTGSRTSTIHSDIRSETCCCRRRPTACAVACEVRTWWRGWAATSTQSSDVSALATRLIEAVGAPYDLDGHQVIVGASVGIALAPTDGEKPDILMKSADLALYRAKADGGGAFRFFEAEMAARMQARHALELDLRKAVSY